MVSAMKFGENGIVQGIEVHRKALRLKEELVVGRSKADVKEFVSKG